MSALGEAFRSAREARGLTLSDVAEHIHIRSVYLAAIEAEEWGAIGAPVYARGFIRSYARFLGLDADDAVARFAERVPAAAPTPIPAAVSIVGNDPAQRRGPSFLVTAFGLIALALVAFVGYEWYQYQRSDAPPVPVAAVSSTPAPVAAEGDASPGPAPAADPSAEPEVDAAIPSGLTVRLRERSWVRVSVDGKTEMEGIYPAGTFRQFSGKRANVRAGNAAGVDLTVGGKHLGTMGAAGDVVERSYAL